MRIEGLDGGEGLLDLQRILARHLGGDLAGQAFEPDRRLGEIALHLLGDDLAERVHLVDELPEEDALALDEAPEPEKTGRDQAGARHRGHQGDEEPVAHATEEAHAHRGDEDDHGGADDEEGRDVDVTHRRPE